MANILTHPTNGAIYFGDGTAGSSTVPALTGGAVSLKYDGSAGLNIASYNTTSTDRFSIDGSSGRLFSVNDSLTGTIFSVNDAAGLPIIEVESTSSTDTITMGTYASNALVVAGDKVGIGTATPNASYKLDVVGAIRASTGIHATGDLSSSADLDLFGSATISTIAAATADHDKFLVSHSGLVKYRTGTEVISDIGGVDLTSAQNIGGNKTFSNNVIVSGNLTVDGTTTTINSTTVAVDDKNIELGTVASPTDATADGGGITLKGATDKTINWINATDAWTFNQNVSVTGTVTATNLYLNNTSTRLSEGSGDSVRITTGTGYIDIGSQNSGWIHFEGSLPYYFNQDTSFDSNVYPYSTGGARNLGSTSKVWNHVYAKGYFIDSTEVIDASRNLTNIGTINSGVITATGGTFTGALNTGSNAFGGSYLGVSAGGVTQWGANRGILTWAAGYASIYAGSGNELRIGAGGGSDNSIILDGSSVAINKPITTSGNVTMGSSGTPKDLLIYGNSSGEFLQYDGSASLLKMYHKSDAAGLEMYVGGGAQPTTHQAKIGRSNSQYLGIRVDDTVAYIVHRQDETDATVAYTRNEIWSSSTGEKAWRWYVANNAGASASEKMEINSSSELTLGGGTNTITNAKVGLWDTAYTHTSATNNPHSVTKSQVGLSNVTNESKATMFASPTFTGTATLPSGSVVSGGVGLGDNSTKIATTAYVQGQGYTNDQTAAEILTAIKTVDGTGTGLDADLLDGNHASAFADKYINLGAASGAAYDTHHWNKTHAAYSNNGSSPSYIVLTTNIPQDDYTMGGFTLILQNQYDDADEGDTLSIFGYWNPEANGGFIGFRYNTSNPECNPTIQVGRNSSGDTVFLISGESGNYATAVAKDMWGGYQATNASSSWGDGWAFSEASSTTGISNLDTLTRNGISATNVSNWNTAYADRNKWDGGSTGLTASTGRTSLGLGSAATSNTSAFAPASHSHAASDITSGTLATARIPSLAASKITSGTFADARIAGSNVTQHQAALSITESQISNFGSYATAGDENIIDGATAIWNADGDGDVFNYNDSNPTHNGKYVGAVINIHGDGAADSSLVRAGLFTSNLMSTLNGYYVGALLGNANSTTTQVINSSGAWTGSVISAAKLSTATTQSSNENSTKIATTAYVKSQGYLTSYTETNAFLGDGGSLLTHPGTSRLIYTGPISAGTSGLFPTADNANSIITLNRHSGNYNSQLGFSSNGNVYYRGFNNTAINTTQGWNTMWHSGNDGTGSGLDADLLDGYQATAFQGAITAPNAPASVTTTIVGETIDVTFAASTTSNIDAYLVYSSIAGSDYGLISVVPPDDFSASMSIIDNSFDETGTQAYRVYAMKLGKLSSATTGSVSYTVSTADPTTMSVVNLNNAYYVQWNPPSSNSRFVTVYNVYKHEHATQASLSRASASLVYSGTNTNYMYQINGTNNNNFHQFWVETTIA